MVDIYNEPSNVAALFLGNFTARLDATTTTQTGNSVAENAATWVNSVQGVEFGPKDPYGSHLRTLQANSYGSDDIMATNDHPALEYYQQDYFVDDAGNKLRIDAAISVRATVKYDTGTGLQSKTITIALFQLDNGDVYLYPSKENGLSHTSLDNLGTIYSLTIDSLVDSNYVGDSLVYHDSTIVGTVICFASGTSIKTENGEIPVEQLSVGDQVTTLDGGNKAISWINSRSLNKAELLANPHLRPIIIRAGALGQSLPQSDLMVSPQHRVLVDSVIAQRMFGSKQVLVAAKHLLCLEGVEIAEDVAEVVYWHFLLDSHQVVFANGAPAESMFPGAMALNSLDETAKNEVLELFPDQSAAANSIIDPARTLIPGRLARKLANRHLRNKRPLYA